MAKLLHKLHITGKITVITGLHIGGSEVELDIGGMDKEVIKIKQDNKRIPYIPGSSLKGKLRALIARQKGYKTLKDDKAETLALFGSANFKKNVPKTPSRLIVRDSYSIGEISTEDKAENTINRLTGEANPRHMERVSKGAIFALDMILDIYQGDSETKLLETVDLGLQILKEDYLGGSGTRGNGKVNISDMTIKKMVFLDTGAVEYTDTHSYQFKVNSPS